MLSKELGKEDKMVVWPKRGLSIEGGSLFAHYELVFLKRIENPVKDQRWSFFAKIVIQKSTS